MLFVLSSLPGVGKTALATGFAKRSHATCVRIDTIEAALAKSTLKIHPAEDAGYVVGYSIAADNLRLGFRVVADSVNPIEITRESWRQVASDAGVACHDIEVICSDKATHKHRVETRLSETDGLRLPSWQDVVDRQFEPWVTERIQIDTAFKSPDACVDALMAALESVI